MTNVETAAVIEQAVASPYWREELVKELLAIQVASGLPLGTFVQRHGLLAERLRRWKRRLSAESADMSMRFLSVRVADQDLGASPASGSGTVEVIAGGRAIRIPPEFCEETLLRLVRVLESAPC